MTLAQARDRVRGFLDDLTTSTSNQRWSDARIDAALTTAAAEALRAACAYGVDLFLVSDTLTTAADGSLDLSAVRPFKITRVQIAEGDYRRDVRPARASDVRTVEPRIETLAISYVPAPTVPTVAGNPFVFGSGVVDVPELEAFMCAIAASELKMLEGSENKGLERRKAELEKRVMHLQEVPSWIAMSGSGADGYGRFGVSPFFWAILQPHTLQLVQT